MCRTRKGKLRERTIDVEPIILLRQTIATLKSHGILRRGMSIFSHFGKEQMVCHVTVHHVMT